MSVKKLTHPRSQTGRDSPEREGRSGAAEFIDEGGSALEITIICGLTSP